MAVRTMNAPPMAVSAKSPVRLAENFRVATEEIFVRAKANGSLDQYSSDPLRFNTDSTARRTVT